ncbi:DUF5692 family protein [Gleimia sp. 6138-11-ORH1]|uniref:DUF5692 family protein n=1 Tax=Gleimia sp. 6138-11-ORH1 TaxID=2973937 RepID=UPI002168DFB7|nr:DUF5692 family protein [Gleimia sp. 6138-11-ORH1]MCS4484148.1 DUF5692 family protein [Gleimia sp. 6138-11-ORH1]
MDVDYPTLFFFEVGEWWDYAMLIVVIAALAFAAWLAQRSKWFALTTFIVIPVLLTIFWWPYSTAGTHSAGWFAIVKQYSALAGALSLVALQYFPKLQKSKTYLALPALLLAVNILEAVIRDIQCYWIHGADPVNGLWTFGGPWNLMNAAAGILNLIMIGGWVGIYVANDKSKAIIWTDLTVWWIIAYDLWNLSYVYNCLSDRAWYSGVALLLACTIPALLPFGKGAWIQYRAYTLTYWSAVVLTFPAFMHDSIFAHRPSHSAAAMFVLAAASLACNVALFIYHIHRIWVTKRNPLTQELYADLPAAKELVERTASDEVKAEIAARLKQN